jgi:flavin reductase (DIM6/NTAB) family NADH-FMN oxidoreductase RutF
MQIDCSSLAPHQVYPWLNRAIMPRPIAWVATISPEGRTNLAPFSFFQCVTANPPTLLFVPANDREGNPKDTLRNIERVPEFVVNTVPYALTEQMNATSAGLPYGESEFEKFGIASAPSVRVRPPRVAAAPVAYECTLHSIVRIGEGPLAGNVVFGRIRMIHVDDAMLDADGHLDPGKLDLIGRLGGDSYTRTTDRFALKRPEGG